MAKHPRAPGPLPRRAAHLAAAPPWAARPAAAGCVAAEGPRVQPSGGRTGSAQTVLASLSVSRTHRHQGKSLTAPAADPTNPQLADMHSITSVSLDVCFINTPPVVEPGVGLKPDLQKRASPCRSGCSLTRVLAKDLRNGHLMHFLKTSCASACTWCGAREGSIGIAQIEGRYIHYFRAVCTR